MQWFWTYPLEGTEVSSGLLLVCTRSAKSEVCAGSDHGEGEAPARPGEGDGPGTSLGTVWRVTLGVHWWSVAGGSTGTWRPSHLK